MSKEASADLTQFRLIGDDLFLQIGEETSRELVDLCDVAKYRRHALCWEHVLPTSGFLQISLQSPTTDHI